MESGSAGPVKKSLWGKLTNLTKMVEYKCANCLKVVQKELISRKIRCPYCGSKVLVKEQTQILDSIKAR